MLSTLPRLLQLVDLTKKLTEREKRKVNFGIKRLNNGTDLMIMILKRKEENRDNWRDSSVKILVVLHKEQQQWNNQKKKTKLYELREA